MIEKKNIYTAPGLTVVRIWAERGFAGSGDPISGVAKNINGWVGNAMDMDEGIWIGEATGQVVISQNATGQEGDGMAAGYFTYGNGNGFFQ